MKLPHEIALERAILISFLGNYFTLKVVAAVVVLVPVTNTGLFSEAYLMYYGLTACTVGLLTYWYMQTAERNYRSGIWFGIVGFIVAIALEFVGGVSSTLSQTGSLQAVLGVFPTFLPFIAGWTTVMLFASWVAPAAAVGWWFEQNRSRGKKSS